MDFQSWMQIGVHAHQRFPWAQGEISECLSFWLDKSLCTLIDCQNCCYVIFRQLVNHQIISSLRWHPCGSQWHEWRAIYLCAVFWLMDRNHHQKFPCIKNYKCKSGFVRVTYKHSLQCRHVLSIHDWSSFCFKDASLFLQGAYTCEEHDCYSTYHRCCTGLCDSECGVCAAYTTTTDTLKYTVCHIRLWFIFVFMQREESHWSNKSCSYLCSDPVQHPAAASDQILAG